MTRSASLLRESNPTSAAADAAVPPDAAATTALCAVCVCADGETGDPSCNDDTASMLRSIPVREQERDVSCSPVPSFHDDGPSFTHTAVGKEQKRASDARIRQTRWQMLPKRRVSAGKRSSGEGASFFPLFILLPSHSSHEDAGR